MCMMVRESQREISCFLNSDIPIVIAAVYAGGTLTTAVAIVSGKLFGCWVEWSTL